MRLFKKVFPEKLKLYGWIAIAALILMNTIAYYGSRLLTDSAFHYDFTTPLDKIIPFIPAMILIYGAIAYVQWVFGYYLSACEDKKTVIYIFGAEIIAKIPSLIIFILLPTTMARPQIIETDIFSRFVGLLYMIDRPVTLFPSFHCLESYILLRTLPMLKKAPSWYKKLTPFVSPLVIVSILFVKQHLFVDILGGIAVSEFGLITMKLLIKLWDYRKIHSMEIKSKKSSAQTDSNSTHVSVICEPE